jgi:hypothetical protein
MAHELDVGAAGTIASARGVHVNIFIALNVEQRIAGRFDFVVDALQLKRVEPDSAATGGANLHRQRADLSGRQFIRACRAFHIDQRCQVRGVRYQVSGEKCGAAT